ncbi:MAG: efflux RND transporter periplasmic adaptor subunit [Pseudomonadota bacterium]
MKFASLPPATVLLFSVLLAACGGESDTPAADTRAALAVNAITLSAQTSYEAEQRFSGQVEASRQSSLGFELGGELAVVLVDEGEFVEAGAVLARLDQRRLQAARSEAQASLNQARAQAALSQATFERIAEAREFDGVSQQELDEATERQQRTAAAAAAAEARLARLNVDVAKSELRAPYDAAVVRRYIDEGQVVAAGQPVIDVQESAALRVRLSVTGESLTALTPGAETTLDINGEAVAATVVAAIPRRNTRTRAVEVIFDIDAGAAARVGDIAELRSTRDIDAAGYWLPLDALSEGARGVWQVLAIMPLDERDNALAQQTGATHRLENRPIELLYEEADRVYARGALRDGDQIVANGILRVVNGQGVRVADDNAPVDFAEAR